MGGKRVVLKLASGSIIATTRTTADGSYSFTGRPRRSVTVYAVFKGTGECRRSKSDNLVVDVR